MEEVLNCYQEIVDSGKESLNAAGDEMSQLADSIYAKTKRIVNMDCFFKYAPVEKMELEELCYRALALVDGIIETKTQRQVKANLKDARISDIKASYLLDKINFENVKNEISALESHISDYNNGKNTSIEYFEKFKERNITDLTNFLNENELLSQREKIINTQNARGEALAAYYAAKKTGGDGDPGNTDVDNSQTVEETNTNTETTDTGKTDTDKSDDNSSSDKGKTDTDKSDDNSSSDKGKTEPTKDTDTKDSDKTFENKPKPDNPPTISDNKGSSGVSHGGSSSNNGNGNYTFTNSGISASQDEPIEILTDEKPGDDQITSLPDDNEDIYTIPTDLSGVTSTKKHSSGGGSGVIPILGGLGAAAAVGVGAKIYMDNKKNNDNDEDSSESDDNTEDLNETSNENDGILADEWNEDDSNFEFDDSEPNMDDDESGFSEI